jgi:hypothetical protein
MEKENYSDYRLRSARQRKRAQYEDSDKKLIKLHHEQIAIWKKLRNLGWVELNPPIQRGFNRSFFLREDLIRNTMAPLFREILAKINTTLWSSKKEFKKRRRKYGRKFYTDREQNLADVSEEGFFSKKFEDNERAYFYETFIHPRWSKQPIKVYRFNEPWRFVLHVQPNMITKVRLKDFDLERRKAEISQYLDTDNRKFRLEKLLHGKRRYKWNLLPDNKSPSPLRNKSFSHILHEYMPKPISIKTLETQGFSFFNSPNQLAISRTSIISSRLKREGLFLFSVAVTIASKSLVVRPH